jgi:hypothetical protein
VNPFREKKAKKSVVPIMGQLLRLKEEGVRGTRQRLRDQTLATVEDPASSPGTRPLCKNKMNVTVTVLRIRITLIRIRILPFNFEADPDPQHKM